MKKILCIAVLTFLFTSCTTTIKTVTTRDVETNVSSNLETELEVSTEKIVYTYYPESDVRKGGNKNVINSAVSEALKNHNNSDVLIAPQYEIKFQKKLFGKKIEKVVVTGYPAVYKNFNN